MRVLFDPGDTASIKRPISLRAVIARAFGPRSSHPLHDPVVASLAERRLGVVRGTPAPGPEDISTRHGLRR